MSNCIEKIEAQQAKLKENTAPWVVGEQLKEICADLRCAELVSADLDNEEMSLEKCEKKIKEYADKHKTGNYACVSPKVAEDIIRKFYGLPAAGESPAGGTDSIIDLSDFL